MRRFSINAFLCIGFALILSACSSANKSITQNTSQPLRMSVTVDRSKTEDQWTVTYHLSQPVTELVFDRQINRFRAINWISKTPGILIKEIDGEEIIVSENGEMFDAVTFNMASYYGETPKDYEFFQAFSDKSLVMYTGHFNACP